MAYEIAFETLYYVQESTRGTAVNTPTHRLPMTGVITPWEEWYEPDEDTGHLAEKTRASQVRKGTKFELEGALDPWYLPLWLENVLKSGISPTTPGGGTNSRLWTYTPLMTADSGTGAIKSATLHWGDPNVQYFRSAYNFADEITISADSAGTDGATIKVTGEGQPESKTSPAATPAMLTSIPILLPGKQQIWLDSSSSIGTTELTDARLISSEIVIPSGVTRKYNANGATATLGFTGIGRKKRRPEAKIRLEVPDTTQYDLYAAGTSIKLRVRINGALIEGSLYNYVEWDIYGPLRNPTWGDLEGSNRTLEFTVPGVYDSTLGADVSVKCQSTRTSL